MSYIRRLPSGKWQATVRGPDGRKHTKTDPLKSVVKTWAAGQGGAAPRRVPRPPGGPGQDRRLARPVRSGQRRRADHRGQEQILVGNALRAEVGRVADERGHPDGGAGLRGQIEVADVMTRQGLRQWPKSKRSHRVVPVPPRILEGMSALIAGRPRDALVFTAPHGGPVTDEHFRNRGGTRRSRTPASAGSRRGSCGTPPPPGWCRTAFRSTTSRRSSGTRTTPPPSGTPTLRRTRTGR